MSKVIGLQLSEEDRKIAWNAMLVNKAKYEYFRRSTDSWDLKVADRSRNYFQAHMDAYVH